MKSLFLIVFLTSGIWSCSPTYQACKDKFGSDTTSNKGIKAVVVDEKLPVKGETKNGEIDLEDLISKGITDTNGQSMLIVYVTDTIRLNDTIRIVRYKVKVKDRLIPVHDTIYVPYDCPPTNNFKDQSIVQKMYDAIKWWWCLILAITIISIGYFLKK